MRDLVELVARALVDQPEQVSVSQIEAEQGTIIELSVAPDDVGKVIGRQGRTVKALRTLLGAAGMKHRKRFILEILD